MNLDSLFNQILLTEKKMEEKRLLLHQVKQEIALGYDKAKKMTDQLDEAKGKLKAEIQSLSEKVSSLELLKKREEILEKQKAKVLNQKNNLLQTYMDTKRKIAVEDEKFLKAVTDFNNEFGLTSNRELLIKERVKVEMCELEEKEKVLRNEIESSERKNAQLKTFELQKNELEQDLFTLHKKLRDLEGEISEAKQITKDLEAEKIKISEKPQTDLECIRLKKKLASYREDEMESACEALQTEIEFLQMKLLQKNQSAK